MPERDKIRPGMTKTRGSGILGHVHAHRGILRASLARAHSAVPEGPRNMPQRKLKEHLLVGFKMAQDLSFAVPPKLSANGSQEHSQAQAENHGREEFVESPPSVALVRTTATLYSMGELGDMTH